MVENRRRSLIPLVVLKLAYDVSSNSDQFSNKIQSKSTFRKVILIKMELLSVFTKRCSIQIRKRGQRGLCRQVKIVAELVTFEVIPGTIHLLWLVFLEMWIEQVIDFEKRHYAPTLIIVQTCRKTKSNRKRWVSNYTNIKRSILSVLSITVLQK